MQFRTLVVSLLLSSLVLVGFSQEILEPYEPTKYMEAGHAFIDEDADYTKAELEFAKVHPNDTLYNRAQFNRIVSARKSGQQEKALQLIDAALETNDDYIISIYLNKVYSLDSLGRQEDAYAVIDEASARFPYNYNIKKARTDLLESEGKYEEAWEIYKECVRDEPLNINHHLSIADFALEAGAVTQAILPIATALALDPDGENNLWLIKRSNYIVSNKPEVENPQYGLDVMEADFEDIDDLVGNYIALDDSYEVPSRFQIAFIKQLYLMITETEEEEGFFYDTYLRPMKAVVEAGKYPEFSTLLCMPSDDADHQKYLEKNMDELIGLNRQFRSLMDDPSEKREAPEGLTDKKVDFLYFNDGKIRGMSHYDADKDILTGPSIQFNREGALDAKGSYDKNGNMTGDWVWYHTNGEVARKSTFKEGEEEGITSYYLDTGILSSRIPYKAGKMDGTLEYYKLIGYKYEDVEFKNDERDGLLTGYYPDQSVHYKYTMKQGKYDGPFTVYYEDGSKRIEGTFSNELYNGKVNYYYRNGQIQTAENYKNGVRDGAYAIYYEDGQLQESGAYKDDDRIGEWKEYNSTGAMVQIEEYDERGKVNGPTTNLDHLGRKETVYMKKKGEITELINYDVDGKEISKYKLKGNTLKFKNLYVNGLLSSEGQFVDELRNGDWKFYDSYGNMTNEAQFEDGLRNGEDKLYSGNNVLVGTVSYKDNMQDGLSLEYFPNGALRTQAYYREDEPDGRLLTYNQGGTILRDNYYVEGQMTGTNKYYNCNGKPYLIEEYTKGYPISGKRYDPNGEVTSSYTLTNGSGVDEYYYYADKKQVMGRIEYKGGVRNGPSLRFHNNGNKRFVGSYVNDKSHGKWEYYYHNGNKKRTAEYEYDTPVGQWEHYYQDGGIELRYQYSYGRLDGEYLSYHHNGKVAEKLTYLKGYLQGPTELYNYNGDLVVSYTYENDVLIGYASPDDNNKSKAMIPISNGTAEIKASYPNGQESVSYNITSGYINGEYLSHFPNGQLAVKLNYDNGKLHGEKLMYFDNGNSYMQENFSYGQYHGEQKYYHETGKLKRTENWLYGEQHGMTTIYDENENVILTIRYIGDVPYDYN